MLGKDDFEKMLKDITELEFEALREAMKDMARRNNYALPEDDLETMCDELRGINSKIKSLIYRFE